MGKTCWRLILTVVPHETRVIRPSTEVLTVKLGLVIETAEPEALTVDPALPVTCAVPIPSTLVATLHAPGLLSVSGDKVSETAAPLQVAVALARPLVTLNVAVPPAAEMVPLFESIVSAVPVMFTGMVVPRA